MEINIRKALDTDLDKMINLAMQCIDSSIPPTREVSIESVKAARIFDLKSTLPKLIDMSHMGLFVAENENGEFLGHVMGYLGDSESVTGERQGWVFDLSVDKKYRRQGVATKLMEHFNKFARQSGFKFVGLLVTTANKSAVEFYEKIGFVEERKRMAKRLF